MFNYWGAVLEVYAQIWSQSLSSNKSSRLTTIKEWKSSLMWESALLIQMEKDMEGGEMN